MHFKTLYFRNLMKGVRKHLLLILIVVCVFGALGAAYGYKKGSGNEGKIAEQEEAVEQYNEALESYEEALEEIQDGIDTNAATIERLAAYTENSVFMKLDPSAICYVSIRYVISPAERTTLSYVQNALASFVNNGELVSAVGKEHEDLEPGEWSEIVKAAVSSNIFRVTVMHYDEDKASEIADVVREKLAEAVPEIAEAQGAFTLEDEKVSAYVGSSSEVAVSQASTRNALRNARANHAEYKTKLTSVKTERKNYIKNNEPEIKGFRSPKKNALYFGIFGLIGGAAVMIAIFVLQYILSDKVRGANELEANGISVVVRVNGDKIEPDEDQVKTEFQILEKAAGCSGIYLQDLRGTGADEAVHPVFEGFRKAECYGTSEGTDPEDVEKMMKFGGVVLIVETGKTTFRQIERQVNLCSRYGIRLLGCVLAE